MSARICARKTSAFNGLATLLSAVTCSSILSPALSTLLNISSLCALTLSCISAKKHPFGTCMIYATPFVSPMLFEKMQMALLFEQEREECRWYQLPTLWLLFL